MGFLGYPKGAASELLDGTLKLRYCTKMFTTFSPLVPRVGNGDSKRKGVTPGHLIDAGSSSGRRIRLTRNSRPSLLVHDIPALQGIQRRDDGKDCISLTPLEQGERWASLSIFFLDLGLGEVCAGNAWNLLSEGTGVVGCRRVRPAEGTVALSPVQFNLLHDRVRA